jgi:hypothetical protein
MQDTQRRLPFAGAVSMVVNHNALVIYDLRSLKTCLVRFVYGSSHGGGCHGTAGFGQKQTTGGLDLQGQFVGY